MEKICLCGGKMVDFGETIRGLRETSMAPLTVSEPTETGNQDVSANTLVFHKWKEEQHTGIFGKTTTKNTEVQFSFNPRYRICPDCGLIETYVEEDTVKKIMAIENE